MSPPIQQQIRSIFEDVQGNIQHTSSYVPDDWKHQTIYLLITGLLVYQICLTVYRCMSRRH